MKEDQIREVMWLVRQYGDKNYLQGGADAQDRELSSKNLDDEIRGKFLAIDTKLRELLPVWHPIDTCPKDGREFQAWTESYGQVVAFWCCIDQKFETGFTGNGDELRQDDFKKWMPLHQAPE